MLFIGISKKFSLKNEDQYNTIGAFWDEMSMIYGLTNLIGLGYKWENDEIFYAIGLKEGTIENANFMMELPIEGFEKVKGKTEDLKKIYDEIYKQGRIKYELETFDEKGMCEIFFIREKTN